MTTLLAPVKQDNSIALTADDMVSGTDEVLSIITNPKVYLGFMGLAAVIRLPETISVLWNASAVNKTLCLVAFAAAMFAYHTTFKSAEILKKERLLDAVLRTSKRNKKRNRKRSRRKR